MDKKRTNFLHNCVLYSGLLFTAGATTPCQADVDSPPNCVVINIKEFSGGKIDAGACLGPREFQEVVTAALNAHDAVLLKRMAKEQFGFELPLRAAQNFLNAATGHNVPQENWQEEFEKMLRYIQSSGTRLNDSSNTNATNKDFLIRADALRREGKFTEAQEIVSQAALNSRRQKKIAADHVLQDALTAQNAKNDAANLWSINADLAFAALDRKRAAEFLEAAADELENDNSLQQFNWTLNAGSTWVTLGNRDRAASDFKKALQIAASASATDVTNRAWMTNLATAHERIASIEQNAGNLHTALAEYKIALSIVEGLENVPNAISNKDWQIVYRQNIASLEKRLGDKEAAEDDMRKTAEIERQLIEQSGTYKNDDVTESNRLYRRSIAQTDLHDYDGAESSLLNAIPLAEEYARNHSSDKNARTGVIFDYQSLAYVQSVKGKPSEALNSHKRALQLLDEEIERVGNNDSLRLLKLQGLFGIAGIHEQNHDLADARRSYQNALKLANDAIVSDPSYVQWRLHYAFLNGALGNMELTHGDLTAAIVAYQAYVNALKIVYQNDVTNAENKMYLANGTASLGRALYLADQLEESSRTFETGFDVVQSMADQSPEDKNWKLSLAMLVAFYDRKPTSPVYQGDRDKQLTQCEIRLGDIRQRVHNPDEIDDLIQQIRVAKKPIGAPQGEQKTSASGPVHFT